MCQGLWNNSLKKIKQEIQRSAVDTPRQSILHSKILGRSGSRRHNLHTLRHASGNPLDETPFGFTGEYTDDNDILYLRARYYAPNAGVFTALDPFEGLHQRRIFLPTIFLDKSTLKMSTPTCHAFPSVSPWSTARPASSPKRWRHTA